MAALARVTEENVKRKQKPRAHASDRDFVSTGVRQSRRAHQSDRKSRRVQEKIRGRLRARESRTVARILAALVNPSGGGTTPGTTATTSVLQRWQQLSAVCEDTGMKTGEQSAVAGALRSRHNPASQRLRRSSVSRIGDAAAREAASCEQSFFGKRSTDGAIVAKRRSV